MTTPNSPTPSSETRPASDATEAGGSGKRSWFETAKREANLAAGFIETKGLRDGHCNRRDCQAPLIGERFRCSMRDHEFNTDGRLYYCRACAVLFDQADRHSRHGPRISREEARDRTPDQTGEESR